MIRRPLCVVGTIFVLLVMLFISCMKTPVKEQIAHDGETITLMGYIAKKETKKDKTTVTLKDAVIYNSLQNSNSMQTEQIKQSNPSEYANQSDQSEQVNQPKQSIQEYQLIARLQNQADPPIGSTVIIKGIYHTLAEATNKGQFDEKTYYEAQGIQGTLYKAEILKTGSNKQPFWDAMARCNTFLGNRLAYLYQEKDAAILKAMLLGDSSDLDQETKKLYQLNGITHVLVISGFNITIIGMGVYKLIRKLSSSYVVCFLISSFIMILYSTMTGCGTATMRALGMFLLSLLAKALGRTYDTLTAIAVVSVIMLLANPLNLMNTGFLLSYTAVLAITVLNPCLSYVYPSNHKIVQGFLVSLSVSIYTFPIISNFFYEIPVYAILLNVVIAPLMDLLLCDALLSLLASLLWLDLGRLIAIPAKWILHVTEWACIHIQGLPFTQWIVGQPSKVHIVMYYLILHGFCLCIYYLQNGDRRKSRANNKSNINSKSSASTKRITNSNTSTVKLSSKGSKEKTMITASRRN